MTNSKSTKRALLASVLALAVTVSMLIGSTFAWFTDNTSAKVNTIQAGTLDVMLEMKDENGNWVDAEGKTLNWVTTDEVDNVLWEPGCTYKLPEFRVKNNGDLDLKYQIVITGLSGDAELLEVITFTYNGMPNEGVYHSLEAGKTTDAFVIEGHMDEAAGNEYMGKEIENIAITLYATQLNSEADSYGPDYDKDATVEAKTAADLANLLKINGKVTVANNITLDETLVIPEGVAVELDLNGKTIASSVTAIENNGTLTVKNGTIDVSSATGNSTRVVKNYGTLILDGGAYKGTTALYSYAIWNAGTLTANGSDIIGGFGGVSVNSGSKAVINGGTYTVTSNAGGHAIYMQTGGELVINGGTFKGDIENYTQAYDYLIYTPAGASVEINGGTFEKFMNAYAGNKPVAVDLSVVTIKGGTYAVSPEKYGTIAEGYEVVDNGNGTWNVQLDVAVGAEIKNELDDPTKTTVVAGEDIDLSKSDYQNGGVNTLIVKDGKTLDLNGNNISRPSNGSGNGLTIPSNATVTVKNGTFTNVSDNTGVSVQAGATATFEEVDFFGKGDDMVRLSANAGYKTTLIFKSCTFTNAGVILGGMNGACEVDVQFINCTFTGNYKMYDDEGNLLTDPYGHVHYTSRLVNAERSGSYLYGNISFDKCEFDFDASESNSVRNALEFKGPSTSYGKTMTVTLKDVTVSGKKIVPVSVSTIYKTNINIVEEGTNTYIVDGVAVNYDGSAK